MTTEEFALALRAYIKGMQLPAALSGLSQIAKQSKDPAANHISQMAMVAAVAAESDTDRLVELLTQLPAFIESQSSSSVGGTIYTGQDSVTFNGGVGENNTSDGVTAQTWVTADTIVVGSMPYQPVTSDPPSYFFQCALKTITPGDGFDFEVYNAGTPNGPTGYTIEWVAIVPN